MAAVGDLALHFRVIGGALPLAEEQEAAQPQPVAQHRQAEHDQKRVEPAEIHDGEREPDRRDGQTAADGDKPDILLEADRAHRCRCRKAPRNSVGKITDIAAFQYVLFRKRGKLRALLYRETAEL